MRDTLLVFSLAALAGSGPLWAQAPSADAFTVQGEVKSTQPLTAELRVELCLPGGPHHCEHTLTTNGAFLFNEVPPGSYTLRLLTVQGELLNQDFVTITGHGDQLSIKLPERKGAEPVSGTVSVKKLRQPVPKAAFKAFASAQSLSQEGRYADAAKKLRKAIEIFPEYAEAHNNLGVQFLRTQDYPAAAGEFQRAIAIEPSANAYVNLAYVMGLMGHVDEAEQAARDAIRMEPGSRRAHLVLGNTLASKGRIDESLQHLKIASTELPHAFLDMARVHFRARNADAAVSDVREYGRRAPDDQGTVDKWLSAIRSQRRKIER